MKKIFAFLVLTFFTVGLIAVDAEARRMGGGKSFGKQRQSLQQFKQNQQQAPNQGQKSTSPGGGSKWGGALAGLAAGGLLAALFMGGAFEGINMMDIMMLILIAGVIMFVMRLMRGSRAMASAQQMKYSSIDTTTYRESSVLNGVGPGSVDASHAQQTNLPPGFKVEPFLRNAKTSFIRLQTANDVGDLNDIRGYTTPEMFAEISIQIQERGNVQQKTEVMFIDAHLINVEESADSAIASVRFTGQMRELPDGEVEAFDEVWHVEKNLKDSDSVWLLAGIQQVADTDLEDNL